MGLAGGVALCLAMILEATGAFGEDRSYPFAVDQDRLQGLPDFSFLNHPLRPSDRIFVRDGHFFRVGEDLVAGTDDDERVRFFGVNFAGESCFPAIEDAEGIARRLRRLGVNLVRLHMLDRRLDRNPDTASGILLTGPYPSFNPVAIARLRNFICALEEQGIYVNLNLHAGYQFRPDVDGVPGMPLGYAMPQFTKPLHIFYPRMVDLQKQFAAELLDRLTLQGDPGLAMVEVNNESSLLRSWEGGDIGRYAQGEYGEELRRQWNDFLQSRYYSTGELRSAWGAGEPDGQNLAVGPWRLACKPPSEGTVQAVIDSDAATVRVQVTTAASDVIAEHADAVVANDRPYIAEIEMKADLAPGTYRNLVWGVTAGDSPDAWSVYRTAPVTAEWRCFRIFLKGGFSKPVSQVRLAVRAATSGMPGTIWLRNWRLCTAGRSGYQQDEILESATISLPDDESLHTQKRLDDYLLFLAERDRFFLNEILSAVREKTDALVPVTGTQMTFGGLLNLDTHADMDYLDNHFYIDHPQFPGQMWDAWNWRIRNQSWMQSGVTTFSNLAAFREAGRPYTISEYNQPWPNTYGAGISPWLAAFAAFQDWDAIMQFAYAVDRGWDDNIPKGFNLNGDWARLVNFGQSAWLFRSGAIRSGLSPITVPVTSAVRLGALRDKVGGYIPYVLARATGFQVFSAFEHPIRIVRNESAVLSDEARKPPAPPFRSDTGEMLYDRNANRFSIAAPQAAGVFGFVGQDSARAGPLEVTLADGTRGYVAALLTSAGAGTLEDAGRLLLTIPGHVLRTQPGSNPARPQQLAPYGSSTDWWTLERHPDFPDKPSGHLSAGPPPVWMERVECTVMLRLPAKRIVVYPLDGNGSRLSPLSGGDTETVEGGFRFHLQGKEQPLTPWYEVVVER